jgi:uncharacterized protein (TIGR04255 family)
MDQKHRLAEVLCAFWFNPESNPWDSTYFGLYYEKLEKLGFTEKEEQKNIQFKLDIKSKETPASEVSEGESRMIFKNHSKSSAIILSNNYISFHKLNPYQSWEKLLSEIVYPGFEIYESIGLGKDIIQVQALYLNKYELLIDEKLSNYFKFLPSIDDFGIGFERNILFQSQYDLDPNLNMLIKLNGGVDSGYKKEFFLECTCFAKKMQDSTLNTLITQAHDQANLVFNKITNK